ncbi:3-deoxy-manno-octulosonate cytidylyltransferase [Marinobacter sp. 1_MG-2023]|uniref:3-deoxy-manno-octulosonate cytidylyltransferase n=1 Tax=Marinobacter sp. 1_MG-2023 TaxID=3062627 RepID=UPI0026E19997|nr:3-deoxy-manno-octulosonate cytidylyltransferase [Marinobacter sp. 1_MG-2023]MDO6825234.1 3-deoxy-manno-octulosonate cytidylyltransferase [Marinobacter sp. 1_MG-2023]
MRSVVLIPARYASSRYPGKPLVPLLGKPMILWVAELAARAVSAENVYVATDDNRIASVVEGAGFQTVMTEKTALTGTDRLAEAAESIEADIYINVQGDEPLVDPQDILNVRDAKAANMDQVVNGFSWLSESEEPSNLNIPKVITNESSRLIYMSRNPLPGFKSSENAPSRYRKQVCIYGFTRDELFAFRDFGRKSTLEHSEDIEILRFFELRKNVLMVETKPGSLAVDVPEDVAGVEAALLAAANSSPVVKG